MAEGTPGRITLLIEQLRSANESDRAAAQRAIIDEYSVELFAVARKRLGEATIRGGAEPQAIADSALRTYLRSPEDHIRNRSALRNFLVSIIIHKSIDQYRYQTAPIRDRRRLEGPDDGSEVNDSQLQEGVIVRPKERPEFGRHRKLDVDLENLEREEDDFFDDEMINVILYGVRPDQAARLIDLVEMLEPELEEIAVLKIDGCSNEEVASKLGVSTKTIADSLKEIAVQWSSL